MFITGPRTHGFAFWRLSSSVVVCNTKAVHMRRNSPCFKQNATVHLLYDCHHTLMRSRLGVSGAHSAQFSVLYVPICAA